VFLLKLKLKRLITLIALLNFGILHVASKLSGIFSDLTENISIDFQFTNTKEMTFPLKVLGYAIES